MISPAKYYPEFNSAEVEETISPLSQFDAHMVGVLQAGEAGPTPSAPDDDTRATVDAWLAKPEEYPFQSVIKTVASAIADTNPLAPFGNLFRDPQAALTQLLDQTEARVRESYTRPLVAAVNHARESGLLVGADPAERYAYFVEQSNRTSFEDVSGLSFPVLRDITRTLLRNAADGVRELCARLEADREALAATFGIDVTDTLESCGFSDGDSHHHGRSVAVLTFASGERLAYKPRDVSCEAAYEVIARELNGRLGTSLVAAKVLERDGYGYVEYIAAEDVSDMSEEFMYASGELAAVFYLLNARDMHFENIVSTRRGPVPIDLETILHPARIHQGPKPEAPGNAYETIGQSIYGIGILPLVMVGKGEDAGHVDLGFLGDQGRGTSPFKTMQFEDPYTDRVRLVLKAQGSQERQTVVGTLTEDEIHALGERMASGFTKVFRAVMADREGFHALLRETAAGVRVRYVHNPTALYAQTLRMTSGPGAVDDYETYIALLKRIAIASKLSSRAIIGSELRQLAERDVPYFTVAATSVALEDGDGVEVGAHFEETPLERALAKTAHMGDFELEEQLMLLYSAFSARFPDNHLAAGDFDENPAGTAPTRRTPARSDDSLTALVTRLSDKMVATSLPDKFAHLPRTWIGPLASAQANRPWPPGVLGYDLYAGRIGPALALAAAGRTLDNDEYRDLSAQIFSTTADILAGERYEMRSIEQAGWSGYAGMAGILFALATAGRLLKEDGWVDAAQGALPLVLDQIHGRPTAEVPLDVISGVAGVMSCVTAIGGPAADRSLASLAALLTDALRAPGHQSLLDQSGFAHGVSGLIHALSQAYPRLPAAQQETVRTTLSDLMDRLQGFYDRDEDNWFSNVATPQSFATGWCHGSAGIALALAAYGSVNGDEAVLRMRETAVRNTLRLGFGRNLTWCHGDLGNHRIVSAIAARTGDAALRGKIEEIEATLLRPDVFERKLADMKSRYAHTNSLMVGSSGIVLHLVNRIDPSLHTSPAGLTIEGR
ncbi:type 2 lanthipeptide synthetase LanM family protein [Streptomyces sp. NPDC053079]|uniref:type 2 lanthipeptide synthetase LanM family protein n=1 Tax=Streptomyces sp. NPDC053079 TaxID=3365697 RepID=UPI0037CE8B03